MIHCLSEEKMFVSDKGKEERVGEKLKQSVLAFYFMYYNSVGKTIPTSA